VCSAYYIIGGIAVKIKVKLYYVIVILLLFVENIHEANAINKKYETAPCKIVTH